MRLLSLFLFTVVYRANLTAIDKKKRTHYQQEKRTGYRFPMQLKTFIRIIAATLLLATLVMVAGAVLFSQPSADEKTANEAWTQALLQWGKENPEETKILEFYKSLLFSPDTPYQARQSARRGWEEITSRRQQESRIAQAKSTHTHAAFMELEQARLHTRARFGVIALVLAFVTATVFLFSFVRLPWDNRKNASTSA